MPVIDSSVATKVIALPGIYSLRDFKNNTQNNTIATGKLEKLENTRKYCGNSAKQ